MEWLRKFIAWLMMPSPAYVAWRIDRYDEDGLKEYRRLVRGAIENAATQPVCFDQR